MLSNQVCINLSSLSSLSKVTNQVEGTFNALKVVGFQGIDPISQELTPALYLVFGNVEGEGVRLERSFSKQLSSYLAPSQLQEIKAVTVTDKSSLITELISILCCNKPYFKKA